MPHRADEPSLYVCHTIVFPIFSDTNLVSVFDAKRLIGCQHEDAEVQADIKSPQLEDRASLVHPHKLSR
jgi:hypothetical protein